MTSMIHMRRLRRVARRYRWWYVRCAHCGQLMLGAPRHANGNRDGKTFHGPCLSYLTWHSKAEERLEVLDLVCDVWGIDDQAAKGVVENRALSTDDRIASSNRAFRVFYDLDKRRHR